MKRFISLFLSLAFLMLLCFPSVSAAGLPLIIDDAAILSSSEEASMTAEAEALQKQYGMDIVILTVDSLNGRTMEAFADDYYDSNGYGDDGVILVLAMQEREWYISTCGDGIYALTDFGIGELGDGMLPYLSAGDYGEAFSVYLQSLPQYFDAFRSGTPIDGYADYSGDYYHGAQEEIIYYEDSGPSILLSMIIGLIVAGITILIMRGSMNSKRPQSGAGSYIKSGSYHLRTQQDLFLYSNISKIRRQENNSSSGGGGSSVHRSGGGRRHGGGGGKF